MTFTDDLLQANTWLAEKLKKSIDRYKLVEPDDYMSKQQIDDLLRKKKAIDRIENGKTGPKDIGILLMEG